MLNPKKILSKRNFGQKNFRTKKFWSEKKIWSEKNFWSEKKFWSAKKFLVKKTFGPKKFLLRKFFWVRKTFPVWIFFSPKFIFDSITKFWSEKKICPGKKLYLKILWTHILVGPKIS